MLIGQAAIGSLIVGYFAYHAVQGDSGFRAMVELQTTVDDLAVERDQLVSERQGWEKRAKQLRTNSLDPDMLEERVRRVLNFTRPNEYVVMTNDSLTQ